jgi:hypothetical protein
MQKKKKNKQMQGKEQMICTLGYLSTGISTLMVLLTIRPDELP